MAKRAIKDLIIHRNLAANQSTNMESDSSSQNTDALVRQTALSEDVETESVPGKGDSCEPEEVGARRVVKRSKVGGAEHLSERIATSWYDLPTDIVGEIISNMESPKDCLSFISVNKSWISNAQSIIQGCPDKMRSSILYARFSLPMILQTSNGMSRLYDVLSKEAYSMHDFGFDLSNKWIAATWKGWLVVTDLHPTQEAGINLVDPVTNTRIALPSWSTFLINSVSRMSFSTLSRVVFASPDSTADPSNCSVYAIVGNSGNVHYCRVGGDNKWRCLFPYLWSVSDLTVHRGLLYAIQFDGSLYAVELKYPCKPTQVVKGTTQFHGSRNYIVESVSGELMLITRLNIRVPVRDSYGTSGFKVCKLVENNQNKIAKSTWEEIESIGEQILFVGYNGATCFDSSSHPGIEGDCIYFAHDFCDQHFAGRGHVGVYRMNDKRIEYFPETISSAPAATWFSPNW